MLFMGVDGCGKDRMSRGVRHTACGPRDGGNRPPALTTPPRRIGARAPFTGSIQGAGLGTKKECVRFLPAAMALGPTK
jgi:hypothetical protein